MTKAHEAFLQLVRLAIGTSSNVAIPDDVDWTAVKDLAERHGLSAVVLDGLEIVKAQVAHKSDSALFDRKLLLQWLGGVLKGYEYRYELYRHTIAEMAGFYNSHGFRMMLLKGYACSMDWPKPEHRPCGDIDIWLFGKQEEADTLLEGVRGVSVTAGSASVQEFKINRSHQHHTVYRWGEFIVENHYDFIDVHHRKSSSKIEDIFKGLGKDDSNSVMVEGQRVYLPSANLHALFLVYHAMLHFTSTEMVVRQLVDWGMFVKKHRQEVDWPWLERMVDEFHLRDFYGIINAICVEDLGFDASIFSGVQFDPVMKERVLLDTLQPEFTEQEPARRLTRFFFRYRRWKSHEWKHRLCYKESMWSIFWTSVWGHILKPESI